MESQGFRSGFVAIVGRPSSGKSSFLNTVCGNKVSIVTPVPQTTRRSIRGIVSRDTGQIVFIDTPGFHTSERKFNKKMISVVRESLNDADAVLLVVDGSRQKGEEEAAILDLVLDSQKRLIVAINKEDLDPARTELQLKELRDQLGRSQTEREAETELSQTPQLMTMSALDTQSAEKVVRLLIPLLPKGEPFYPPEYYTDQDPGFRITEIVREKAMRSARQELPHSIYVGVQDSSTGELDPLTGQPKSLSMRLAIYVERESQKGILVGKGGSRIKEIREAAQKEINALFDYPVTLELRIKVDPKWRKDDKLLEALFD